MTTIIELLNMLKYRNDRLEMMLTRLSWPLPGHLGAKWLDDVADSYLSGVITEQDVADAFLDKYRKHGLEDLRHNWIKDSLIEPRLTILLDALSAHQEGHYTLSVPVLFAQLEGLVATTKKHKGRFTTKNLKSYLEPIREKGSRFQRITAQFVVETLWSKRCGRNAVVETLWSEFCHGSKLPALSRHAVLHGADIQYGTASNSLRAILYFDNIRSALNTLGELDRH